MAHRADGKGSKEGQSSEPHYITTGGGVLVAPAIYQNGLPGDPPKPKMRGDAKPIGTAPFPGGGAATNRGGGPLGAFGFTKRQGGGKG